jgi:hypothetical protein
MRKRGSAGIVKSAFALLLGVALLGGSAGAAEPGGSLEPLLKVADFEKIGVKGVALAPPDAYDRIEQLGFERASDSSMVVVLARLAPTEPGGSLKTTLEIIAKDVTPVSGVGDEAYSYLGGMAFAFRKGKATFQLMCGLDMENGAKLFLTKEQLVALAKAIAGRL